MTKVTGGPRFTDVLTIPVGASVSNLVNLNNRLPVLLVMAAAWTGVVPVTFRVSRTGLAAELTKLFEKDGVTERQFASTLVDGRSIVLPPSLWAGVQGIQVASGLSGSEANQATAARVFYLVSIGL